MPNSWLCLVSLCSIHKVEYRQFVLKLAHFWLLLEIELSRVHQTAPTYHSELTVCRTLLQIHPVSSNEYREKAYRFEAIEDLSMGAGFWRWRERVGMDIGVI